MNDVDKAIATYRSELETEAHLARADLDEIEDHLRSLIDDLRAAGVTGAAAIAEARRRLGEPRAVAREHARVRSPFGSRLSRLRAWSAAALLLPFFVDLSMFAFGRGRLWSSAGIELVLGGGLMIALAARLTWARVFVLGVLPTMIMWTTALVLVWNASPFAVAQLVAYGGVLAFILPWRRGELTAAGLGLALIGPAYSGAATLTALQLTASETGSSLAPALGPIAIVCVLLAGAGGALRARWGTFAALGAALCLASATVTAWDLTSPMSSEHVWRALILTTLVGGAVCAAASALLMWRAARSNVGSLRSLAR